MSPNASTLFSTPSCELTFLTRVEIFNGSRDTSGSGSRPPTLLLPFTRLLLRSIRYYGAPSPCEGDNRSSIAQLLLPFNREHAALPAYPLCYWVPGDILSVGFSPGSPLIA